MPELTARQRQLLAKLQAGFGVVTTGQVRQINSSLGAPKRTTARRDIAALVAAGRLAQWDGAHDRIYLLIQTAASA